MQPIKILVIGDVHVCDHSPGRRIEGYKDHILTKLYECVKIAEENNVTHVLFLGDIFHVKVANRVSHRLVQDMSSLFNAFNLPVLILVGNHDITDGTLDTLGKQPLGTLEFLQSVTLLKQDSYTIDGDVVIHPIPGITGISLQDFSIPKKGLRDIMVVHQSIVPDITKERELLQEHLFDAKAIAEHTDIEIILYGHQHRHDGVYHISKDDGTSTMFSNLGSICRLSITDEDVNKKPRVMLLSIDSDADRTVTTEVIELQNVLPPHEAYFIDEHIDEKNHIKDIQETVRKLKETEVSAFSIESVISDVEVRPDIDVSVRDAALELLEEVR